MSNKIKVAILGGDARQAATAAFMASCGLECAVWGLNNDIDIGKAVRCDDIHSAIGNASSVILPLPASVDGVRVSCPLNIGSKLKLSELLDEVDVPILGGRFTSHFIQFAQEKNKKIFDYYDSEELKIKNALPTAEGAISIAMNELKITISGCEAAVIGFGRLGSITAELLKNMGAHVTLAARNTCDLAAAGMRGMRTMHIDSNKIMCGMVGLTHGYDLIINTVPIRLFSGDIIQKMSPDTLIVDLASAPGGVDFDVAHKRGIKAIWALSLPGKYAPISSGVIIGETVLSYLESEGIIEA